MPVTKDQILGALPSLSQQDLKVIQTLAGRLLLEKAPNRANEPQNAQAWLFRAMQALLNYPYALPASTAQVFKQNAPGFVAFAETTCSGGMARQVDGLALLGRLLQLLADDLKGRGLPISMRTMVAHLPRMATVFDAAFPGYLQSGLAQLFMSQRAS